ncbi:MAG: DUF1549 domain-containing protein [Planctomycetes bacterium]|nr:DUF1549 domain-containing protein [Planctomycetota bacterium]
MRQVSKTTSWLVGRAAVVIGVAALAAGCGGSGGGGGGGSASVAPGVTGVGQGQLVALEIAPPGDVVVDDGLGSAFQVIVDGHYRDGSQLDLTRAVELRVSDESVAKIGGDGLITPIAPGTTELTVSTRAVTGETLTVTKRITVVPAGAAPNFASGGELRIYPQFRTLGEVDAAAGRDQLQQIVIVGTDAGGRMWDLTRSVGAQVLDRNRAPSMAGQLSPTGLFRGVMDGQEVLVLARLNAAGLTAGAQFRLGGGAGLPPSALFTGGALAGSSNAIDRALLAVLQGQFAEPSALSSDAEFLRRLYSDALGRVPTAQEAEAFDANQAADKRDAEIDRVVATPAFAAHWANQIGEWLRIPRANAGAAAFDQWVAQQIQAGQGLGQIVAALAAGTAPVSATFDGVHPRASDKVDVLVMAATGMTSDCAVCHDHPLTGPNDQPRWLQSERYPLDAFFAANAAEATPLDRNNNRIGQPFQPGWVAFAGGTPVTSTLATPMAQRRAEFAQLLTNAGQFDRGMAHRIFATVMQPLLDPNQFLRRNLDAVAVPGLLEVLAARFRAANTDLRAYVGEVFKSKAYQLSSIGTSTGNDPLLARHVLRRHHSEVMESLVESVTGQAIVNGDLTFFRQTFGYPLTRQAIQERSDAVNMSQALVLMNSPVVQNKISANGARVATLAGQVTSNAITREAAVTQLFRAALSREPSTDELGFALQTIQQAPTVRAGLEDVAAAVMSTIEAVAH